MLLIFVGDRGAGKTTIAQSVYSELQKRKIHYINGRTVHRDRLSFSLKFYYAIYLWKFFDRQIFNFYFNFFRRNLLWHIKTMSLSRLYFLLIFSYHLKHMEDKENNILIYDHDMISWFGDGVLPQDFSVSNLRDFYTHVILSKVDRLIVVRVNTPSSLSTYRWCKRENASLPVTETKAWRADQDVWKQVAHWIIQALSGMSKAVVITVDGADDPKTNALYIIKKINAFLS